MCVCVCVCVHRNEIHDLACATLVCLCVIPKSRAIYKADRIPQLLLCVCECVSVSVCVCLVVVGGNSEVLCLQPCLERILNHRACLFASQKPALCLAQQL